MSRKIADQKKIEILKKQGTLNPHPERVKDPLFIQSDFFDPHDLVQIKYELLRRVEQEGVSVAKATSDFGVSRTFFYRTQQTFAQEGLAGFLPKRRGPQRNHKLSEEIMVFIEELMSQDQSLKAADLQIRIREHFGVTVHPRSIERALARRKKTVRLWVRKIYRKDRESQRSLFCAMKSYGCRRSTIQFIRLVLVFHCL